MVSIQDRMRRLAFAKYLIEIGSINADNVLPYSAMALLNFHDALEFLFDLILEENGLSSNNFIFMGCFDKINEILKDNGKDQSSLRGGLGKLKDRRVGLKHKGSFPSSNDVEEAKYTTTNLFNEFCLKFYNLNYEDIDLIELLNDSRTKDCLLHIRCCEDNKVIIDNFALAFSYLLKDYENNKIINVYESPYQLTKKKTIKFK